MQTEQVDVLQQVVSERDPHLRPLVSKIAQGQPISDQEASQLRNVLLVEMVEREIHGVDLSPRGAVLDEIVRAIAREIGFD